MLNRGQTFLEALGVPWTNVSARWDERTSQGLPALHTLTTGALVMEGEGMCPGRLIH